MSVAGMVKSVLVLALAACAAVGQDNMRASWMPHSSSRQSNVLAREATLFLAPVRGAVRLMICRYDSAVLRSTGVFVGRTLTQDQARWKVDVREELVAGRTDAMDLEFVFTLTKGNLGSGGVAVAFDFHDWRAENYVLAPAAVYNGNRYRMMDLGYNAYIKETKDKPLDMPITITNVMRLNLDKSPAKIEMLTGNCATPMIAFYDSIAAMGCLMLTEQGTRLGNSGLFIEEHPAEGKASFVVSAPGVREKRYVMCGFTESGDKGVDLKAGAEVRLRLRLFLFKAASLQQFFEKVFSERKALSGPSRYRQVAPFSAVADMVLHHHDLHKYHEDASFGYICNHPERDNPWGHLSPGGSVPVWSYPQVIRPTPERLRRVAKSFDAMTHTQGKSGFFHYFFYKGKVVGGDFINPDLPFASGNTRVNGELLYFGLQTLELLQKTGNGGLIKPAWNQMMQKTADAVVTLWKRYGQFGNLLMVDSGEIDVPGSTAGAEFISGLALASRYFSNREYMQVAEEAGEYYCRRDLSRGYTGGGPGDILLAQDSESANFLADAYIVLYEMTGKEKWLRYAQAGAALLSTWVVSYDYRFPDTSDMFRAGTRTTGSVWASIQNAHSAPGLYVMSGTFLLKLYRATGDRRYVELLRDIIHNVVQYANSETNNIIPRSPYGSATERVNTSDWEGSEKVGDILDEDSNMAWETVILFSVLQNPGIYVNHDTGEIIVFDNVEAKMIGKDVQGITLEIMNPTRYDAEVAVLSENNTQRKVPLDMYGFTRWGRVKIGAGETRILKVSYR